LLCWILLVAVIVILVFVLVYFVRIDRSLQAVRVELEWFREQLKPWGFISPKKKG